MNGSAVAVIAIKITVKETLEMVIKALLTVFTLHLLLIDQIPQLSLPRLIYSSRTLNARIAADPSYHVNKTFYVDGTINCIRESNGTLRCLISNLYGNDLYRGRSENGTFLESHIATVYDKACWIGGRSTLHRNFTASYTPPLDGEVGFIANMYVAAPDCWVGFVHIERSDVSMKVPHVVDRNYAIGIASSQDSGRTWWYHGDIIRSKYDALHGRYFQNIGGVPYVVTEEEGERYFYCYYNEHVDSLLPLQYPAVAREKVTTVLSMVDAQGVAAPWKKYNAQDSSNRWLQDGFSGWGSDILKNIKPPSDYYVFDMHTDATYVVSEKVFVLLPSYTWAGHGKVFRRGIKYLQSTDGITWEFIRNIVATPGKENLFYAYASIAATDSKSKEDGSVVQDGFTVVYSQMPGGDIAQPHLLQVDVAYPSGAVPGGGK